MFINPETIFSNFKGVFAENYAIQQMTASSKNTLYYWEQNNPKYEIDIIFQHDDKIIPAEVKADTNIKSLNMNYFYKNYGENIYKRLRISLKNVDNQDDFVNIPLYLINAFEKYL